MKLSLFQQAVLLALAYILERVIRHDGCAVTAGALCKVLRLAVWNGELSGNINDAIARELKS